MNIAIKKDGNDSIVLEVESNIYDKKAILSAAYKFSNISYVFVDKASEATFKISFKRKNATDNFENIPNEFCNELLDQQIRINVERDFGEIRLLLSNKNNRYKRIRSGQ